MIRPWRRRPRAQDIGVDAPLDRTGGHHGSCRHRRRGPFDAHTDRSLLKIDPALVTLREITADTVIPVVRLAVADSQKGFVAPNAVSLAQALFAPAAWYRAVHYADEVVGFVMLEDGSLLTPQPAEPEVGVWRFMIDARFQGKGIGRAALLRVIEHVRGKGLFRSLQLSYVPGPGCPEMFYRNLGFQPTGRLDGDEVVLELPLAPGAG
ncbi:MAG: GNAT family N-acetyltransferase [Betaproteobacteria bacterium]